MTWLLDRDRRVTAELRETPRTPIAALSEGIEAKVVGTLHYTGEVTEGPWSGRECALYEVSKEGPRRGTDRRGVTCLLRDETGEARVALAAATLAAVFRTSYRDRDGVAWREAVVREGELVAVLGEVTFEVWGDGAAKSYRDLPTRQAIVRARLIARDGTVLL